jgi:glucose-6-phosphate-specific signal transduction histidine kinase
MARTLFEIPELGIEAVTSITAGQIQTIRKSAKVQPELKVLEETFRAISQNLHDNIGSNISTAMLLLYTDENMNALEQEANRKEALVILDRIVNDLKNIARSLNPDYLFRVGLKEAIRQRIEID